jgi:hypothetical protein
MRSYGPLMLFLSARVLGLGCSVLLACVACTGCQTELERAREREEKRKELRELDAMKPPSRRAPVGILSGQVQLAADAQLPQYAPIDLARRPLQQSDQRKPPDVCATANEAARTPVQRTENGMLSGIVVAASDFTRQRDHAPRVHKVWIENCRLRPTTIAATGGDTLQLVNTDEFEFEPLIGPSYKAQPLPQGKKLTLPLIPGGIDSLLCSLGAGCGRTDIVVFFHTVHAVTNENGSFRIPNFPASENVRVTAWHPLFEATETFVWLDPNQQSSVKLVISPKPRFVPGNPQAPNLTTAGRP